MRNWRWFIAGALAALNGLLMGIRLDPPQERPSCEAADERALSRIRK
jgi:hypothetical protein